MATSKVSVIRLAPASAAADGLVLDQESADLGGQEYVDVGLEAWAIFVLTAVAGSFAPSLPRATKPAVGPVRPQAEASDHKYFRRYARHRCRTQYTPRRVHDDLAHTDQHPSLSRADLAIPVGPAPRPTNCRSTRAEHHRYRGPLAALSYADGSIAIAMAIYRTCLICRRSLRIFQRARVSVGAGGEPGVAPRRSASCYVFGRACIAAPAPPLFRLTPFSGGDNVSNRPSCSFSGLDQFDRA